MLGLIYILYRQVQVMKKLPCVVEKYQIRYFKKSNRIAEPGAKIIIAFHLMIQWKIHATVSGAGIDQKAIIQNY